MVLNDGAHGYTLNGKSFPATEPIGCAQGQRVRIRFMNEGMMIHPMHLHGRWDVLVRATNPGIWAFHCHILPHAESEHGMFGMVTVLNVKKAGVA